MLKWSNLNLSERYINTSTVDKKTNQKCINTLATINMMLIDISSGCSSFVNPP